MIDKPKACAGNRGTIIQADDLFYNLRARRDALRNPSEEMKKIVHVIQRYALHFSGQVGFVLRKQGVPSPEVSTQGASSDLDSNVGVLFGADVANNLLRIQSVEASEPLVGVRIEARCSSLNYVSGKRLTFILFINHRLVECAPAKRMVQEVYSRSGLMKGRFPFVYASFHMDPQNLDVNVHPTKKEVRFRYEEQILTRFELLLEGVLKESATQSRPFVVSASQQVHEIGPSILSYSDRVLQNYQDESEPAWREVRVSSKEQKLDAFLVPMSRRRSSSGSQEPIPESSTLKRERQDDGGGGPRTVDQRLLLLADDDHHHDHEDDHNHNHSRPLRHDDDDDIVPSSQFQPSAARLNKKRLKRRRTVLASVLELLEEVDQVHHVGLSELLRDHVFVGFVDCNRVLIQHRLVLYLMDAPAVARCFIQQEILEQFEGFDLLRLSDPPLLQDLCRLALVHGEGPQSKRFETLPEQRQKEELQRLVAVLSKHREMLQCYFGIHISNDLRLVALPQVVEGLVPDWAQLPRFVLCLASKVTYLNEKDCFRQLTSELANFLAPPSVAHGTVFLEEELAQRNHLMQYVLLESLKSGDFKAPKHLVQAVTHLTSLDVLYKIFERC